MSGFLENEVKIDATFIDGTPSALNKLLREGHLDISLISTTEYIKHKEKYHLIDGFGIAAKNQVKSVFLYTKGSLNDALIGLTAESATSVTLLKLLCTEYWRISPTFEVMKPGKEYEAFLLIGDMALSNPTFPGYKTIDLAGEWHAFTGFSMPFAVLASTKKEIQFSKEMRASLEWGRNNRNKIIAKSQKKLNLSKEQLESYFNCLTYEFSEKEKLGLELFLKKGLPYV